ncbi:MAG: GNAT family N-acetyltransferase [Oscillospiraceae bacterium]|nr:GNAT family N-acetyltransferase [Oscillospiraceae bacterium]
MDYRREGWLSSHGTMEHFNGYDFLRAALAHSAYDSGAVLMVMHGDAAAGILELDFEKGADEGVGAIPFYYLDPAHRCHGSGIQLLGQAISVYRALGRRCLRLRCAPENERAYRFYCRNGFVKIGMAEDSVVPLYLMERPID